MTIVQSRKGADDVRLLNDTVERAVRNSTALFDAKVDTLECGHSAIRNSIVALRELLETRITRNADVTIQQFNRIDQLLIERDKRVDQMLIERDKRLDQSTVASAQAIAAALQAQKEAAAETQKASNIAIAKAEVATADSIKQLQTLFQTAIGGLNTQVSDVKSRLDKGEAAGGAGRTAFEDERTTKTNNSTRLFAVIAIVVSGIIGLAEAWNSIKRDDSISKVQNAQFELSKGIAKNPVERNEIEAVLQRLDALSSRMNSIQQK